MPCVHALRRPGLKTSNGRCLTNTYKHNILSGDAIPSQRLDANAGQELVAMGNTQINHAAIADVMTPFRTMLQSPWLPQAWNWHTMSGVTALNGEVTRQAATIAYLNDFTFMMWVTLLSAPLLLLLRKSRMPAVAKPAVTE